MLAAYAGLFAWSFAAATFLPLSSEVPLAVLVRQQGTIMAPVAVATVGNYLGACTTYWIAAGVVSAIRKRRPSDQSRGHRRAVEMIRKWGAPALLLSWVPVFGDALVAAAGGLRVGFGSASLFLILGKLARYLVVAWAALAV
jgi:membrane protein YqaA with SNARE-associated domain